MIIKIAIAIYEAAKYPDDNTTFEELSSFYQDSYLHQARAVLKVMREPTTEMLNAALHDYMYREKTRKSWNGTAMWKAMIDEATKNN